MIERLRKLRNSLGLNQKEFSQKINIGSSTLAMLETGQRAIKDIHISQICSVFNVSEHWLRTGEGEMFQQLATFSLDDEAKKSNLSELEIAIMRSYMSLDRETRDKLMDGIEAHFKEKYGIETAATVETIATVKNTDQEVEEELDILRQELKAEKKGRTSSASRAQDII